MDHFFISGQLIAITWFGLGLFVYLKDRSNFTNKYFALFSLSVAIYGFGFAQQGIATEKESSLFWIRIIMFGTILIPIFFLQFIYSILKKKIELKRLVIIYSIGILFEFMNFFSELLVKDPVPRFGFKYLFQAGIFYPVFFIFFAILVAIALYSLHLDYQQSSGLRYNQLRWLFWASLIGFIGGSNGFWLGYNINTYPLNPFASYGPSIFGILIAYAVAKYRLMDITFAFKKWTVYSAGLLLTLAPATLLILWGEKYFFNSVNLPFSIFLMSIIAISAITFHKLKTKTESALENTLFYKKYNPYKILSSFTKEMVSVITLSELLDKTINTFVETLKIKKASIFLFDEEKKAYIMWSAFGIGEGKGEINIKEQDALINYFLQKKDVAIREEIERYPSTQITQEIIKILREMESEIAIPFMEKDKVVGFCNLGIKGDRGMYSHEDIELFLSLGRQAAITIQNAQLVERIKESKHIIRRMERLKTIGDMAAGLAHEIRNPLVPIKTCLQLLPERYGKDEEFTEKIPMRALQEVERIEALLKEIMDYSRPRAPVLKDEDINDIVEKTVIFVEYEAKKKGIKIERKYENQLPMAKVDNEQIKQVILNLIFNAIDAVNGDGKIEITTRKTKHILSPTGRIGEKEYIQIEVTDNGMGIPEENIERIFNPFYTTKHESKEREGTGLGLSIVQEIVTEHNGFIQVKSELGKGTTFLVNLPIDLSEFEQREDRRRS